MRASTASLAGLTGLPVAAIALIAFLPMTSSRGTPPAAPLPEAAAEVEPPHYSARADTVGRFDVGGNLLAEAKDTTDRVRTLLVLLPDPEESSLDWMYDAHLAALRQSLESAEYIGHRMWFPDPASTAPDSRGVQRPTPELFPGVMLFRRAGRSPDGATADPGRPAELLVVYVVGELPTSGVHMPAMRAALDEAAKLDEGDTLRILGPTFSGSFPSLRLALQSWNPDRCGMALRVMTGSATSASGRRLMRELTEIPCGGTGEGGTLPVEFEATVHTDDDYVAVLEDAVLRPLGLQATDVALLTEASTAYGQQRADSSDSGASGLLDTAVRIPFPLNVGTVRTAYERNPQAEAAAGGLPKPTARLPLSLHLEPRPLQLPVPRSRLTPATVDEIIADAMATLRAQHVRAVGIMATDVRDKLFLAQVVRRELPDVVLFTLEGSALFARRDLSHTLRGMVVVSTYPLIRQNGVWLRSEALGGFPMDGAAGVFNAAALLMDRPELVQQYRAPFATCASDADSDKCLQAKGYTLARPPVWVTVVGSGVLLPLTVRETPADPVLASARSPYTELRSAPSRPGLLDGIAVTLGGGIVVLLVLLAFFSLLQAVLGRLNRDSMVTRASGVVTRELSTLASGGLFRTAWKASEPRAEGGSSLRGTPERLDRVWLLGDRMAVLVAILACLAPLAVLNGIAPPWSTSSGFSRVLGMVIFGELVLSVVVLTRNLVFLGGALRTSDPQEWIPLGMALFSRVLTLVFGAMGIRFCLEILALAGTGSVDYGLYRFRTLRLDSGASGLLPFLVCAVGAVLLVIWQRDRRDLLSEAETPVFAALGPHLEASPVRDAWTRSFQAAGRAMNRIRGCLDLRIDAGSASFLLAAAAFVTVLLRQVYGGLSFRTLEDVTFGALATSTFVLWIGLGLGFFGVIATILHTLAVWDGLRRFLGALAETPIGAAFSRIPPRLRAMGRLHLIDPSSASLGDLLAEAGHESLWEEALEMETSFLQELGLGRELVNAMVIELHGPDLRHQRLKSQERLLRSLRRAWARRPNLVWVAGQDDGAGKPDDADPIGKWLRHVEDVFAIEGAVYVGWVLRNLRRITLLMLCLILFTTAMLEVIPFPFHAALTGLFIVLVMGGVGLVLAVMVQLAQDDVLSRINGTEPGKLNFSGSSLVTALVVVALPVFSLLGTEVAPIGQTLFGWVTDLLKVLGGG